jgi:CDP-4-dehydro-6-deoxyglucose reductase
MRVIVRPRDRLFDVDPGERVLAAALSQGLNLPHSCRGGSCGACRARLVAGRVRYPRGRPLGLTAADEAAGVVLLCQAEALSDLTLEARELESADDAEVKRLPCRVERLERRAPDVMALHLRLPAVETFRFRAGQYLDVLLPGGRRRSFSIASPPHDAALLELHVGRVAGGLWSPRVFDTLAPGALLTVEGPFGQFGYREPAAPGPAILVAGGTGLAPLKAILRSVLEGGGTRALHLYCGARDAAGLYEDAWLAALGARHANLRYVPVLSAPGALARAHDRRGELHAAVLADWDELADAEVYAAGPPALIAALRATLPARGLPPERLYFDSFELAADGGPPAPRG